MMMEVHHLEEDINFILNRLDKWVQTENVPSKIPFDKSVIYNEPYGVALVMGAWNYPLQLTMLPVAGRPMLRRLPKRSFWALLNE